MSREYENVVGVSGKNYMEYQGKGVMYNTNRSRATRLRGEQEVLNPEETQDYPKVIDPETEEGKEAAAKFARRMKSV